MDFDWDERKNEANIAKHGISFRSASRIFDGLVTRYVDDRHDYGETRFIATGVVAGLEVTVVCTIHGDTCRIISARRANQNERRAYRQIFPR
ncbi:MAG: BrnT family toxin [Chloroflexota bacterium]